MIPKGDILKEKNTETELKLRFRPEDQSILRSVPRLLGREPRVRKLSSTYFDTPGTDLRNRGLVLRVRKDGGRYIQTVKSDRGNLGSALDRLESETPLPSSLPDITAIPDEILARRVGEVAGAGLKPMFRVEVERTTIPTSFVDDCDITVDIDVGEVRAGRRRRRVCEIELESNGASPASLFALARELHQHIPLRVSLVTKSDQGYDLRECAQPTPKKAGKVVLENGSSVGQGLQTIVQSGMTQLLANDACVLTTTNPEGIHQMRVALRRLRSAFRIFRSLIPAEQYASFTQEMQWLTSVLGPARDWDVFSLDIVEPVLEHFPDHEGLSLIWRRTKGRRERYRKAAREGILSRRFTSFILDLSAWLTANEWQRQQLSPEAARLFDPIKGFSTIAIGDCHRKVRKLGKRIADLPILDRHRLRINVKRLRYATEFFDSLYPAKPVKIFSKRLARLQDDLGHLNDIAVAGELSQHLVGASSGAEKLLLVEAKGILVGWHTQLLLQNESVLRRDIKDLLGAPAFWHATRR